MLATLANTTTTNFSTHFSFNTPNFFPIIMFILAVVGTYMVFQKVGEKGWKAIIPFYKDYVMFDLFWEKKYFWMQLAAAIVTAVATVAYKYNQFQVIALMIFAVIMVSSAITYLVLQIKLMNRLAKAFGHGTGFTVGLVLFKGIFLMILGLDKNTYKAAC